MSLPHARGGVSGTRICLPGRCRSSPRTWGCFYDTLEKYQLYRVFPTHVGVFLSPALVRPSGQSLPHARGGVSAFIFNSGSLDQSSPRTWGCFLHRFLMFLNEKVFPTHVGVFLHASSIFEALERLPHARGGVSLQERL